MFEVLKAYKNLKKSNEFLKGAKIMAELTGDEEMLKKANESLYLNEVLKGRLWKHKTAKQFNLGLIKNGL